MAGQVATRMRAQSHHEMTPQTAFCLTLTALRLSTYVIPHGRKPDWPEGSLLVIATEVMARRGKRIDG